MIAVNCTFIQLTDIFFKSHLWSQCCAGIHLSGEYVSHPSGSNLSICVLLFLWRFQTLQQFSFVRFEVVMAVLMKIQDCGMLHHVD